MIYNMASFQNEVRKMIDEKKPITLMHLWVMVFENLDHSRYASNDRPHQFLKEVLCTAIKGQISNVNFLSTEYENRKVYPIMRKAYNDSFAKSEIYDRIFNVLIQDTVRTPCLYLNEQYDTLRHLAVDPNAYADKLWNAMLTKWSAYENKSYIDILYARARWLFKDHEKDWKEFDAERIYKLLTVAIAISLNQKTWTTKDEEDSQEPKDPLDILCRKFLYAGPPEVLPDFTLRDVFETLFSDDSFFAVKRARDDEYVMETWDNLTDRDQLCILLAWLGTECDLHPESDEIEAAAALMDNKIATPEIADRVRKFFVYFSNHKDDVWNKFVAHLKESLTLCTLVDRKKKKPKASIDDILKQKQPAESLPDLSERYLDILDSGSGWSRIDRDKFWNGDQVDISLPGQCENEEDVQQLYQYIAAYVLIALCCLKVDDPQAPEERKIFKEKLIQKIHNPTSISVEKHEEIKQENEALKRIVAEEKRKNNEMTNMFRRLLKALLFLMHMSASVDFSEVIKGLIREVIPHCDYTQNEMAEIEAELEKPFRRFRGKDSPGWDNGGN